jgi:hypothetical protein
MAKSKSAKKERRHSISCLGALLIVCMLLLAAVTLGVNLLYRGDNAPKIGKYRFCYYTSDEMLPDIPAGTMVIAEESDTFVKDQLVLYRDTAGTGKIGKIALTADNDAFKTTTYYLTVDNSIDPEPTTVPQSSLLGVCTYKSAELGVAVGFLNGMVGLIVCLIMPCIVLMLYLIAAAVAAKEHASIKADEEEEGDTDLAFVKSIQKKQQQIAERDAERMAKTGTGTDAEKPKPTKQPRRYTDEELAQLEEQEAARRAERIAAVRSHMEQRRQTETPDGVPLITTEVLTRTHPIAVPKTGELTVTRQQTAVRPGTTGQIPKPAADAQSAAKPEKPAEAPAPAPETEAPAEPAAPAAPAEPAAPPATYEELMAMLDEEIKKLQ